VHGNPSSSDGLSLLLASAINRFLNLVSHIGERKFGLTKYYDVAAKFEIPDWVVSLRHETTHGAMPTLVALKRALQFAIGWIRENYWRPELERLKAEVNDAHPIKLLPEYSHLHDLLDCYGYLKLYSIWGTERVGDLKDQDELYTHITRLWKEVSAVRLSASKKRGSSGSKPVAVEDVLVHDAVHVLRNDLDRRLGKAVDGGRDDLVGRAVAHALVNDQLLLPAEDFLNSLSEEDSTAVEDQKHRLPNNLVRVWFAVLKIVASHGMMPRVCKDLVTMAVDATLPRTEREMAAAWIRLICREPADNFVVSTTGNTPNGKKKKKSKVERMDCGKGKGGERTILDPAMLLQGVGWKDLLQEVVMTPHEATQNIIPILLKLQRPRLGSEKERSLLALMETFLGQKRSALAKDAGEEFSLKTVCHVLGGKEAEEVGSWQVVSTEGPEWSDCPLGLLPGQDVNCLHQYLDGDAHGDDELNETETYESSPYFEVTALDWESLIEREGERFRAARKRGSGANTSASEPDSEPASPSVPAFYRNSDENRRFDAGNKKKKW
jgi:hypothetical protein